MKFARLLQVMHRHYCGGTCNLAGLLSVKYRHGPDFAIYNFVNLGVNLYLVAGAP